MQILTVATCGEPCGIADYDAELRRSLEQSGYSVDNFGFRAAKLKTASRNLSHLLFRDLYTRCLPSDCVILNYEIGIFGGAYGSDHSLEILLNILNNLGELGKPTLVVLHSDLPDMGPAALEQFKLCIKSYPTLCFLTHSSESRRRCIDSGIPAGRAFFRFHPIKEIAFRQPKPLDPQQVQVAIFGFIFSYKGYEVALRALELLPSHIRLVIAGAPHPNAHEDTTLDSIYRFIRTGVWSGEQHRHGCEGIAESLANRVTVTGYLDAAKVEEVLDQTDIVLAPYSNSHAGSGSVSWALAAGRPIIASTSRAFTELQSEAGCFKMVCSNAPYELASAIMELISSEEQRKRFIAAGAAFKEKNTWCAFAKFVADILEAACKRFTHYDGDWIDFYDENLDGTFLAKGWGTAEHWGRWTVESTASITLLPANHAFTVVELDARAFLGAGKQSQRVNISVNGSHLAKLEFFVHNNQRLFEIPLPGLQSLKDGTLTLYFGIADTRSPSELGLGTDVRQLGIGISRIRLR